MTMVDKVGPEDHEEREDIGSVLPGFQLFRLPESWVPTDVLCLVKCLDESGTPSWVYRASRSINREELLGVLRVHAALTERELVEEFLQES
jgi:hypothetical protein